MIWLDPRDVISCDAVDSADVDLFNDDALKKYWLGKINFFTKAHKAQDILISPIMKSNV